MRLFTCLRGAIRKFSGPSNRIEFDYSICSELYNEISPNSNYSIERCGAGHMDVLYMGLTCDTISVENVAVQEAWLELKK
jgi:hypothetical protein